MAKTPTQPLVLLQPLQQDILHCLVRHHLFDVHMLHQLFCPQSHIQRIQRATKHLRRKGLIHTARQSCYHPTLCWPTSTGLKAVHPELKTRQAEEKERSSKNEHTLGVARFGVLLSAWIRRYQNSTTGHAPFGYTNWQTEVTHQSAKNQFFRADAVVRHQWQDIRNETTHYTRIIEYDRGTEPVDTLREKVLTYIEWSTYKPAETKNYPYQWKRHYSSTSPPPIVFVFDTPNQQQIKNRIRALAESTQAELDNSSIEVLAVSLEDLKQHGPFTEIATSLRTLTTRPLFGAI